MKDIGTTIQNKLSFDIPILIAHAIAVVFLLIILARFVYYPFRQWLNNRQKLVADYYLSARKSKLEAQKLRNQAEKKMLETHNQAQKIIANTQNQAQIQARTTLQLANQKARQTIVDSEKHAKKAIDNVQTQIKVEIVKNAVNLSAKLLKRELKSADHQELIEEFIKDVKQQKRK